MAWDLKSLDFAFQPIVNARTGLLYGVEALVRGTELLGFETPLAMLDAAFAAGELERIEKQLMIMAIRKFATLPSREGIHLFLNLDTRQLGESQSDLKWLFDVLSSFKVASRLVTIEVSERYAPQTEHALTATVALLRNHGMKIALDDFGQGVSGLRLCFDLRPNIIKVDRYFLQDIDRDARRRSVVASMITLAHGLGIGVVAEGIETRDELRACQELGVDLIQGWYVAHPSTRLADLRPCYNHVGETVADARRNPGDGAYIAGQIETIPTVVIDHPAVEVLALFEEHGNRSFIAVVEESGEPIGIIREIEVRKIVYGGYGRELLKNRRLSYSIRNFLTRCPIVDVNSRIDELVQAYSTNFGDEGVLITKNRKLVGFLSSRAILGIVSERNIANARDQNPLTRLPGNRVVADIIAGALIDTETEFVLAYFDFDNFKPFNDVFGFRQGDRALMLFAELLGKSLPSNGTSVGHIGGDDFFAAFRGYRIAEVKSHVEAILKSFKTDIESFYDAPSRMRGHIIAKDRENRERKFPLMRASCAIVALHAGRPIFDADEFSGSLAKTKHGAKLAADGIAILDIPPVRQTQASASYAGPRAVSALAVIGSDL